MPNTSMITEEIIFKIYSYLVHIYVKKKRTSSEVKVIVGPFKVKKNNYIVALLSQNIFIKVWSYRYVFITYFLKWTSTQNKEKSWS